MRFLYYFSEHFDFYDDVSRYDLAFLSWEISYLLLCGYFLLTIAIC